MIFYCLREPYGMAIIYMIFIKRLILHGSGTKNYLKKQKRKADAFSSPFDPTAVDFLETLGNPIYKVASFEITDIPLIEYIASKGKPMIISTGIAGLEDIKLALNACKKMGNEDVALLKCTSSYPAPMGEANLIMIKDLADRFGVISGLSDHTLGTTAPGHCS